jgi:hypothetical protein
VNEPQPTIPEGLVKFAQALVETEHLRSWFYALERLSESARNAEFTQMAARMRIAGEDAELISAVALLTHPKMYELVLATVRTRADESAVVPD